MMKKDRSYPPLLVRNLKVRWDKHNSRYVNIKRPNVVGEYGVDLLDSIIGIYEIRLRNNRWPMRLFYHYTVLGMANGPWIMYKRVMKYKDFLSARLSSADFRPEVAVTKCKLGINLWLKTLLPLRKCM